MDDYTSRQAAIDVCNKLARENFTLKDEFRYYLDALLDTEDGIKALPSADVVEVVRCKDCLYGYRYFDVQNGETDSWIECRNPDGLNRDVPDDGYCSASIRK